jgi:hypothetical protein
MSSRSGDREEVGGRLGCGPALRGPRLTTRRSLTRRNSTPERAASRGHDGGAAHPTRSVRHESSNLALIPACGPRPGQPTPKPGWLPPPHPGPGRARRFRDRNLAATLDRHSATTPVGQTLAIPMSHAHEGDKTRSQRSLRAHFRRSAWRPLRRPANSSRTDGSFGCTDDQDQYNHLGDARMNLHTNGARPVDWSAGSGSHAWAPMSWHTLGSGGSADAERQRADRPRVCQAGRRDPGAGPGGDPHLARTRSQLIRRAVKAVEATHGPGVVPLPGKTTFYKVIDAVAAGRHTFDSAVTRRQTANRPHAPFTPTHALRPGEQVQIDSKSLALPGSRAAANATKL